MWRRLQPCESRFAARKRCATPANDGTSLRNRERVEDVGEPGGEADRRIDRRQPQIDTGIEAHRPVRVAAAELQDAAALRADERVAARRHASIDLPDDL